MKNENETTNTNETKRGRPVDLEAQARHLERHAAAVRKIEGRLGEVDLRHPVAALRLATRMTRHLARMLQIDEVIASNS